LQTLHSLFLLTRDIDIHLFVKGHPQPFPRDQVELTNVVGMYPHVRLLPSELSLLQLKELGVDLLITGWGTCAVEGAYLGIPVIAYTRFSSATEFGLLKVVPTPDRLSEFLQDRASWALCGNKDLAIDAYAATDVMRSVDWCGIDFERLESELGKSGGYQSSFYKYWDDHSTVERETSLRLRIQRYLDSKSQWLTLLHM
jgi:hypothetical protein